MTSNDANKHRHGLKQSFKTMNEMFFSTKIETTTNKKLINKDIIEVRAKKI